MRKQNGLICLIWWIALLAVLLLGLCLPALAQTGSGEDARVQQVLAALGQHPELTDHLRDYVSLGMEIHTALAGLDTLASALASVNELKSVQIPGLGSAWEVLCSSLRVFGVDACKAITALEEQVEELIRLRDRIQRWQELDATVSAIESFQASPNSQTLQELLQSAETGISILEDAQSDLSELGTRVQEIIEQGEMLSDALSGAGEIPGVGGLAGALAEGIDGSLDDWRALQSELAKTRILMGEDSAVLRQVLGRKGGDMTLPLIIVALIIIVGGIIVWFSTRRRPAPAIVVPSAPSITSASSTSASVAPAYTPGAAAAPATGFMQPRTGVALARLTVLSGPLQGLTVPLAKDDITIGRGPRNGLTIPDSMISRLHCRLRYAQGAWYIQDQNSTNGTFVNNQRVMATRLHHGDRIRLGSTDILFEYSQP